jgi:pilus assembly protein CpaE
LDTATTFDNVSAAAIHAADRIVVVATPTMPSLKDARILLDEIHGADVPKESILLVLNEIDKNSRITAEQIGNYLKHEVAAQIPIDPMAVEAVNQGKPLVSLDPRKAVSVRPLMTFVQAVKDSIERVSADDGMPEPQRRGLFGRLGG